MNFFLKLHYDTKTGIGTYCSVGSAGLRFYKIQLYTVISLHTQLYTAHLYIRHNSIPPQFDTQQLDTSQFDTTHFETLQLDTSQLDTA